MIWASVFLAQKITLTTADLGRHLKNGEWVASQGLGLRGSAPSILNANTYSYTHPDYPTVNHHWGSGLIFFVVHRFWGFEGLSALYVGVLLAAWALMLSLAARRGGWRWAVFWAMWLVPILVSRREVRPEAFSVLMMAAFVWLYERRADRGMALRALGAALVAAQVLWSNLHIYFVLGPAIAGLYALDASIRKSPDARGLWTVFAVVGGATFLNPSGVHGVLYPLKIFGDYGYRLVENQSIPFLERLGMGPSFSPRFAFFKATSALVAVLVIVEAVWRRRWPRPPAILALVLAVAGWRAIRNMQIFSVAALPVLAGGVRALGYGGPFVRLWASGWGTVVKHAVLSAAVLAAAGLTVNGHRGHPFTPMPGWGVGLAPQVMGSAEFFKEENLRGPIFNNYDIGGYLIYTLWPSEKVFVDNRPEAYPGSFFNEVLIPSQDNEDAWQKLDAQYRFNVIFFSHHDLTPWGQAFMLRRLDDPEWAPVYADPYALIFLRRTVENAPVIVRRELPRSMFRVKKVD